MARVTPGDEPRIVGVVHDTDAPFRASGETASTMAPDARVAGLSLMRRAILTCARAGATRVYVAAATPDSAARWAGSESNLTVPVEVVPPGGGAPWRSADLVLATAAQYVVREGVWERLLAEAREHAPTLVHALISSTQGPGVVTPGALWPPDPTDGQRNARLIHVGEADCPRIADEAQRHAVDAALYQGLTSITDGWVDRVFNRKISGWFTRRIIDFPITPNHVTWFHFTLGLLAAWLIWQGDYWPGVLGALLLQLSVALDCSDGEVARLKFQFSKFGSMLDVVTDNIVTVACFAAIAKASVTQLGVPLALTLGVSAALGVLMSVAVIFGLGRLQERRHPGEASALAATNRLSTRDQARAGAATLTDRVINEATSRDFSVLIVGFLLLGRPQWFAWLAGVGSHVFWVIFGAIQLRRLR